MKHANAVLTSPSILLAGNADGYVETTLPVFGKFQVLGISQPDDLLASSLFSNLLLHDLEAAGYKGATIAPVVPADPAARYVYDDTETYRILEVVFADGTHVNVGFLLEVSANPGSWRPADLDPSGHDPRWIPAGAKQQTTPVNPNPAGKVGIDFMALAANPQNLGPDTKAIMSALALLSQQLADLHNEFALAVAGKAA